MQFFHTINFDNIGTGTAHICPHAVQEVSQIYNFRFFRRIFNDGSTFCSCGSHHDMFRCTYAREIQINTIPLQSSLRHHSIHIAMINLNGGT